MPKANSDGREGREVLPDEAEHPAVVLVIRKTTGARVPLPAMVKDPTMREQLNWALGFVWYTPRVDDPFTFATRHSGRLPSLTSSEHTKVASSDDVSRPASTQPTSVQPRSRMTLAKFPGGAGWRVLTGISDVPPTVNAKLMALMSECSAVSLDIDFGGAACTSRPKQAANWT